MATARRLAKSLGTPENKVEKLQRALQAKANAEPNYRFYSLWDKIARRAVIEKAYRHSRKKGGVAGVDGITFSEIEETGRNKWLRKLEEELTSGSYRPQPLRRVWIDKSNGGKRALSIPTIKDRVVQMAATIIIGPIFEADLEPSQYGFRPKLNAKMAIRRIYYHVTQYGRTEVVDADLKDYFNQIPHGQLMKSLTRRIADGTLLKVIKMWMEAPVTERKGKMEIQTTKAKNSNRGIPQGSPISPLFSNIYFRRFILAWRKFGYENAWDARVVNYADDYVICTKPGNGKKVMVAMRKIIGKIGLQVNESKTRTAKLPHQKFDFLGYTIGRQYARGGRSYIGTCPSKKAKKAIIQKIREVTARKMTATTAKSRIDELNPIIRGWANYFNQGPVLKVYDDIEKYTCRRLQKWLVSKHKQRGLGYRQYPEEYLHQTLGLIKLPTNRADLQKAKA